MSRKVYRNAVVAALVAAGSAAAVVTATIQYPESTAWEIGMGEARRGWVGGSLSRTWVAVTQGATTYAVHIRHNGSGANPIPWVSALTGATEVEVTLGAGNQDGTAVAAAVASALTTAGLTGVSSTDDVVSIINATVTFPASVDTTDRTRTGMYGYQRDTGEGATQLGSNGNGGTNATTLTHIPAMVDEAQGDFPASRNGRLLGVYFWGHGGHQPRLGAGRGPTQAQVNAGDPIEILGEGVASVATTNDGDFSYTLFTEPVAFTTDDELWAMIRSSTSGGPRFRQHSATVALPGDLDPTNENTLSDTTTSSAESNPFDNSGVSAGEYTPTIDSSLSIHMAVGLIFELEDASGNYAADGAIDDWHGDQNTDVNHGTQFDASSGLINPETTWHRHELYGADVWPVAQFRRVYGNAAAGEDSRMGIYGFFDLDFPSTTPAELLVDLGLVGVTAGSGNRMFTVTLGSTTDIGEGNRTSLYPAFGGNYVTTSGAALATMELPVFLSSNGLFQDCWVDNGRRWHDDIVEANQHAFLNGVSEYRTTNTGMPHDSTAQTFPATFVTDASDDSPDAIAAEAFRIQRAGVRAAA